MMITSYNKIGGRIGPSPEDKVLRILADVTQTGDVQHNLDLALFEEGMLDSFSMVELILALSEGFDVTISPAEIDRRDWASPRRIVAYMEQRLTL